MLTQTWSILILTWTIIVFVKADDSCTSSCYHNVNKTAPLHFLNTVERQLFSPPGQWFEIGCCADGFTDIEWHYHSSTNNSWQPWPWFKPCEYCSPSVPPYRELCDRDQKLQLLSTSIQYTGSYRCNVSNSVTGEHIIREYDFIVSYCDNIEGDIKFSHQPDSSKQRAELGKNVTLTCAGYFGCPSQDNVRQANWSYIDSNGNSQFIVKDEDEHFEIIYNQSFPDINVESILTIIGVEERDYQLTFQCNLATSTLDKAWNLTLHRPANLEQTNMKVIIIAVSVVGGITVLLMSAGIYYCCFKQQIEYRMRRQFGRLRTRSAEQENYHDGCIISSEENASFVEENIKKPLEQDNYDIFTKKMVPAGKGEVSTQADNIDKSMCAILILSRAEIEDKSVGFLFSVAIDSCGTNILVIEKDDINEASWRAAVEGEEVMKNLPRILETVKWQGEDKMSKRQKQNFLFAIKLKLPEPRGPSEISDHRDYPRGHPRMQSNSSSAPLLSGHNSSVSSHSSVHFETPDSRKNGKRTSSGQMRLSSSDPKGLVSEDSIDQDDVFTPSVSITSKHPQKQLSQDSGIVTSPT